MAHDKPFSYRSRHHCFSFSFVLYENQLLVTHATVMFLRKSTLLFRTPIFSILFCTVKTNNNKKPTISITGMNSSTIRAFFYSIITTVNWNLTLSICLSFLLKLFWLKWQSPNYLLTAQHYLEDLWDGLLKKSGTWKKGKKIDSTL